MATTFASFPHYSIHRRQSVFRVRRKKTKKKMRLLVRPLSLWVAYTLTSPKEVARLLPEGLVPAPARLLCSDTGIPPSPKLLFNAYEVSSTFMRGHRLEIQTLALDTRYNTLHLVVLDCLSNAPSWDPSKGVYPPNSGVVRKRVPPDFGTISFTDPSSGDPLFKVEGSLSSEDTTPESSFVVEANRLCYFGNSSQGYHMTFDEKKVTSPVRRLSLSSVRNNELWKGCRSRRPSHVFAHTGSMEFDVHVPELWYGNL